MNLSPSQQQLQGNKRERILFLSMGVPPLVTGQTTVVTNLAAQFSRDEMIVAGEKPYAGPPFQWREDWPEIIYLIKSWPITRRGKRLRRRLSFPLLLFRCLRLARRYRCKYIVT